MRVEADVNHVPENQLQWQKGHDDPVYLYIQERSVNIASVEIASLMKRSWRATTLRK